MDRYPVVRACPGQAVILALLLTLAPAASGAALERFLGDLAPGEVFPGADRIVVPAAGALPVADAFAAGNVVGHVFVTSDVVDATGYSGKPVSILVGVGLDGVIRSARLVEHHEPIVLIGIPERRVAEVIDGYVGLDLVALDGVAGVDRDVDIVSGATVTILVIDDSIVRAGRKVVRTLGLGGMVPRSGPGAPPREVDMGRDEVRDWWELVAEGAVRRLKLTVGEVNRTFVEGGDPAAIGRPEPGSPGDPFMELHAAVVSVPGIGRSLLGDAEYRRLAQALAPGEQAILLAGAGRYSFKGSGYVRGGIFDRFHVVQGERSIRFRDHQHKRLRRVAAEGAPDFTEVDLFRTGAGSGFRAAEPWRVELLVGRATGARTKAFRTFVLDYALPETYLLPPEPTPAAAPLAAPVGTGGGEPPLWRRIWRQKLGAVGVLALALAGLTVAFFFQTALARRPALAQKVRVGFLLFTLFVLGFHFNAQLSVVNILTVFNALVSGFDWSYFLMEPLVFVLWGSVAVALVFWGRGAYCGWLCPFGALQELGNRLARWLGVPQVRVPWALHERLWAVKYLVFLGLFGTSLHSLALAERLAEVEPFKTAVIMKFDREWPFIAFAGVLLAAGLFIERFYCRYLCGLGAALAIPARMRTFEWLKRYRQCGNPCQRCRNECMVQAIHPEGHINPNECLYCLHCQEVYLDEHRCPVMIAKREKRERRASGVTPRSSEQIRKILDEVRSGREQRAGERTGS